ncbi:MAG TPA: glycosyltransferase family 1 protein [Acidobacteriota bacterium]|nr:glycosyltransferase family 1 protein [Acidobacteriota bacterium]
MHVCIDYRPALHESTGVGTYVRGLLAALVSAFPDDRHTAFSASWKHRLVGAPDAPGAHLRDVRVPVRLLDWLWHRRRWPPVEHWVGDLDIAHSPSPMLVPTRRARRLVTVHDCYFARRPDDVSGAVRRDYVPLVADSLRRADAVIAVSETTKQELQELFDVAPERIHVTYNGVDAAFGPGQATSKQAARAALGVERPYLLFVGRRDPRKDLGTLLTGFGELAAHHPDLDLLLVGPDGYRWENVWGSAAPHTRQRSRCMPHQPTVHLAALYEGAEALVLSSRWEGFGLTAVEAMASGTPVVASRAGALPEVLGDAASWFEVGDAAGLAQACDRAISDSSYREDLVKAGIRCAARYTWHNAAVRTRAVYDRLLK